MPPQTNVLIAVPTMGSMHPMLVSRLIQWGKDARVNFYFTFKVAPVDRARNQIVEFFLTQRSKDGEPFTHLLMIDSDTIPPEDALTRLFSHGKPVVTGLTPILSYNTNGGGWETYDNAFVEVEKDKEGKVIKTHIAGRNTGLQEVFRCGASCLLIERSVIEGLDQPYFRFVPNEANTSHVRSEDIDFCDRVRAAGIQIYADTDVIAQHYKDIML